MTGETQASDIAAGAQIVVRDEEWLVRSVHRTEHDGLRIEASGASELVRDQDAVFFTELDDVEVLDPRKTELVADDTPGFRRSRLWLESLLRQSSTPVTSSDIVAGHQGLADRMDYQLRPAHQALSNLRPRILIGDAVGLGKTLEIGITLTELIERGRGERILVVTPRAVLEQFQHEMWTRYSIPLVRLDSDGIQKVRQTLPASRNPFSYYRRAIVSIDTLKNPARYRHHLAGQHWDAIVIDECHNLINRGTQNNELARLLARQTDALILASATPHNGKPESFAELINLLDPTAIADPSDYRAGDIKHLYVRRHRNSSDVKLEVGHKWAPRHEPSIVPVTPTAEEHAVLDELRDVWLHPESGTAPVTGKGRSLFPWTLFKAFLSSPHALRSSIKRRLATLESRTDGAAEATALSRLDELAEATQQRGPAKLEALIDYLREIGIARGSDARVVVFSERIDTLLWLREQLRSRLKLPEKAVDLLHAQLPDADVQDVVEDFALAASPIRVLLASDMASEGINLHRQCHRLVHYDLPWSFIRIQQRNGRIDRYLQENEPRITALALTADDPTTDSDLRVVTKLLDKEHTANQALGDAGALLDLHDEDIEEDTVMRYLEQGQDLDEAVPQPEPEQLNEFAALMATGGEHEGEPAVPTAPRRTLFDDDDNFLTEALEEIAPDAGKLNLYRERETDLIAFDTPKDLAERLGDLPESYLREREIRDRIRLSAQPGFAEERLAKARAEGDTLWPDVGYLAPIHPVLEWATSRALARFRRDQAPVVAAEVPEPVFLTQATWSNALGQAVLTHWGAITGLPDQPEVGDLREVVERAGLKEQARNPGEVQDWLERMQPLVPQAVEAASADLRHRREAMEGDLLARLDEHRKRLGKWEQQALFVVERSNASTKRKDDVASTRDETSALIDSLATSGEPFVRVVGLIVPAGRAA
ncbi:SNF2 domain-containing protein [Halopolyspora algeriensis]|uniref:SNF2 domain-containing protein n=1 Tax=Halopolyspora algeriensis TaxID=1500506 RepID=A0A368VYH5_9ACTN|nr:DEAD/DEAH box helicase [Halopolyspora algeriensis]RCW45882.1 SNF2 domain-containing protein [Halopolyspora algeriensis]TQM55296.1 SNF2 domain-containing protein [Halopolyspora algeriensis]